MENKRVLLTGISGFVGSHVLAHILKNTDWDVVGIASWKHKGTPERIEESYRYSNRNFQKDRKLFQKFLRESRAEQNVRENILALERDGIKVKGKAGREFALDDELGKTGLISIGDGKIEISYKEYEKKLKPRSKK